MHRVAAQRSSSVASVIFLHAIGLPTSEPSNAFRRIEGYKRAGRLATVCLAMGHWRAYCTSRSRIDLRLSERERRFMVSPPHQLATGSL